MEELKFHLEGVVKAKEEFEDFNGPLDLILYLMSKNRIEIKDIKISLILDQFMEYIAARESMDLVVTSDFVAMAAHLVYLKTRMLLSIDDEQTQAEMEQLIKSLEERSRMEEYKRMKSGSEYLRDRSEIAGNIYVKAPEPIERDKLYKNTHDRQELVFAIDGIQQRTQRRLPPPASSFRGIVGREPYPISAKITEIVQRFLFRPVYTLKNLLRGCGSRSEIVAAFLAVLELCRGGQVEISGENNDIISVNLDGETVEITSDTETEEIS